MRPTVRLRSLTAAEKNPVSDDDNDAEKPEYPLTSGVCRWEYKGSDLPGLDELMGKEEEAM
eukprot:5921132-Pleurochrysis_carterae.AAC.1